MKKLFIFLGFMLGFITAEACTSAIISGRLTQDGRPIMWKNRDTSNLKNCLAHFNGERYSYTAVVASSDINNPRSIWMGSNETGFSIMNTVSYNLKEGDEGSRNGTIMKRALEICKSIEDFKNLLDTLPKPLNVATNYGVIDAYGGAAYFETHNNGYTICDVNESEEGFIARANFSFSGKKDEGVGYVRYQQAYEKIHDMAQSSNITPQWLLDTLSRSFENPLMGVNLEDGNHYAPQTTGWFCEQDFIARRSSSCAMAIQGVKKGENPDLTVMWTLIGYPPASPIVPVWCCSKEMLPKTVSFDADLKDAPICFEANKVRERMYSYKLGKNKASYFNFEVISRKNGTGMMQLTRSLESELIPAYYNLVQSFWKKGKPDMAKISKVYELADSRITEFYKENNQ